MGMQELLLAGSELSQLTHVGLSSCDGGGNQEQEELRGMQVSRS